MVHSIRNLKNYEAKRMGLDTSEQYRVKTMSGTGAQYIERREPGRFGQRATWVVVKLIQE